MTKIPITIKTSRVAKHMRLTVYPDGRVVATRPWRLDVNYVKRFIQRKIGWIEKQLKKITVSPTPVKRRRRSSKDYRENKEKARKLVTAKLEYFNQFYNFKYHKVAIRNQKSRWGSCSLAGNLNFNYKIIYLTEKMADYLIVHELCHLKEFNHSARFWELVGKKIPDYKVIRKELRRKHISVV